VAGINAWRRRYLPGIDGNFFKTLILMGKTYST
jgi:hypothetical protein